MKFLWNCVLYVCTCQGENHLMSYIVGEVQIMLVMSSRWGFQALSPDIMHIVLQFSLIEGAHVMRIQCLRIRSYIWLSGTSTTLFGHYQQIKWHYRFIYQFEWTNKKKITQNKQNWKISCFPLGTCASYRLLVPSVCDHAFLSVSYHECL